MQGRCFGCKDKKEMKDVKIEQNAKGGYMARGLCKDCGGKMCAMVKKEDAQKMKSEAGQ